MKNVCRGIGWNTSEVSIPSKTSIYSARELCGCYVRFYWLNSAFLFQTFRTPSHHKKCVYAWVQTWTTSLIFQFSRSMHELAIKHLLRYILQGLGKHLERRSTSPRHTNRSRAWRIHWTVSTSGIAKSSFIKTLLPYRSARGSTLLHTFQISMRKHVRAVSVLKHWSIPWGSIWTKYSDVDHGYKKASTMTRNPLSSAVRVDKAIIGRDILSPFFSIFFVVIRPMRGTGLQRTAVATLAVSGREILFRSSLRFPLLFFPITRLLVNYHHWESPLSRVAAVSNTSSERPWDVDRIDTPMNTWIMSGRYLHKHRICCYAGAPDLYVGIECSFALFQEPQLCTTLFIDWAADHTSRWCLSVEVYGNRQ